MKNRIDGLKDGPLDIIGDVHGEWSVLRKLLDHLGYDEKGRHPQGRTPVFVGDLCDRGPDSPGVMLFVANLVEQGLAQCVLGNHELNLIRRSPKEGNGWWFQDDHDLKEQKFLAARRARSAERIAILGFLESLPVALQRDDLRVVHACWRTPDVDLLRDAGNRSIDEIYKDFERRSRAQLQESGITERAKLEKKAYGKAIKDSKSSVPMLTAIAASDEAHQMGNPLRVLTSGVERKAARAFWSSGKWRFVERVPWWDEYADQVPVVIGHYWRWEKPVERAKYGKGGPDLFDGVEPNNWLGARRNVFCVDFSIGRRFEERDKPSHEHRTRLAALRWPERVIVYDNGKVQATVP